MKEFSQLTIEKLGYYVYTLTDPFDGFVFYVGKGQGNRVFAHVNDALETETSSDKLDRIRQIIRGGEKPIHSIIRHGMDEQTAFEVEAALIDAYGFKDLHNEVLGHGSDRGISSARELEIKYAAEPVIIEDPVFLGFVTGYDPELTKDEDLFRDTSYCWKVNPSKHKAKYAFAVHRMIIREVYVIETWLRDPMNKRWYFEGYPAPEDVRQKYLYKDISSYIVGTTVCKKGKRKGQVITTVNQNLKWVNC